MALIRPSQPKQGPLLDMAENYQMDALLDVAEACSAEVAGDRPFLPNIIKWVKALAAAIKPAQ